MTDHKEFPAILETLMSGKTVLPNYEALDLSKGIAAIAAGGGMLGKPDVRNAKVPGSTSSWGHWARYFLARTQGGDFDGTGYVIWYDTGQGRVGKFAICKHQMVAGAGANPSRGWHPGKCSLCGLDMSVDSGD